MSSIHGTPGGSDRNKALPVLPEPTPPSVHILSFVAERHEPPLAGRVRTSGREPSRATLGIKNAGSYDLASPPPVYDKENIRGRNRSTTATRGWKPSPIDTHKARLSSADNLKTARSAAPLSPRMEVTNQARAAPTSPPSGLNTVITTTGLVATLQTSIQVTTENLTSNIERKEDAYQDIKEDWQAASSIVDVYDDLSVYTSSPASVTTDLRRSYSDASSFTSNSTTSKGSPRRPPRSRRPRDFNPSGEACPEVINNSSLVSLDSRSTPEIKSASQQSSAPRRPPRSRKPPSLAPSTQSCDGDVGDHGLATARPGVQFDESLCVPRMSDAPDSVGTLERASTHQLDVYSPDSASEDRRWELLAKKSDMTHSTGNQQGRMISGTIFEVFRYLMRVPNARVTDDPALIAEMRLRSVFWSTWRHHTSSAQFFAYVRAVYSAWSSTPKMIGLTDFLVQSICSQWFSLWLTDADEPIAHSVRQWIEVVVERSNPYHAGQLLAEFEARQQRTSVHPVICDIFMNHDATQAERALKLDLPKDLSTMGYLSMFMEGAGLEEFVRQLTLIFSQKYKTLPPSQILILDWFLGGEDRNHLAPEREFLDLYNNLYKWVVRGITESVSEETCVQITLFWMEVEKQCFERRNLAAAAAIHDGLESAVCSRRWEKHADTFVTYKNKLLKIGRSEHRAFTSHKQQKSYWVPGPAKDGANYHDLILTNRIHDDGPFIPHLARHRAPAVRHKGAGKTSLGWTQDGQVILRVDVLRELSQMSIPLEWGYRAYHYPVNHQVQDWIKSKLGSLQDWTAPSLLDPEGKAAKMMKDKTAGLKPSPTLPHLLLQANLPKDKSASASQASSMRTASPATSTSSLKSTIIAQPA